MLTTTLVYVVKQNKNSNMLMITKGSKTHRELKDVNLEKLEGIGPSKELP